MRDSVGTIREGVAGKDAARPRCVKGKCSTTFDGSCAVYRLKGYPVNRGKYEIL